ncbi:hypothetical protein [Pseudokineococcus lusitanus]|uniref:Uncharacterized protein n=1 Tax=Pseudokineococcus lusitanus TaxID=763993 RepID=A0A3N1HTV0_9ACTN|nr:hypothetical protein [Pseudokineococcus lusitanus]ROP45955.1 hypothetical protein EDC03_0571 [Pseudokineococcus lusitanus]
MAITSTGYNGEVDYVAFSQWQLALGDEHGVEGSTDLRVTPVAGKERTVAVAPGAAYGWGVRDVSDAVVELQAPAPSGTALVWHTVAVRRDYAAQSTSLVLVQSAAGDGQALAAALDAQSVPGVVTLQGLATFSVRGGVTAVQAVVDHRRRTTKVRTSPTLSGLGRPGPGLVGMLDGEAWLWRAELVAGSWTWQRQRDPVQGSFGPTYVGGVLESLPASRTHRVGSAGHPSWRSWPFPTQFLGYVDVPNQNRPYRLVLDFNFVAGTGGTGSRFAYFARAGSADAPNLGESIIGGDAGPEADVPQTRRLVVATPTAQVFTGATRVYLVAERSGDTQGEVAIVQDLLRATPVYAD